MNMNRMTEPPNPWDRLPTETIKSYAAFRAYCAMGAKRSVREAAHQNYIESASSRVQKDEARSVAPLVCQAQVGKPSGCAGCVASAHCGRTDRREPPGVLAGVDGRRR